MQKRRLGQTDIEVTSIGLGGNKFGGGQGMISRMMSPDLPREQINAVIQAALDGGINWFDTAELYGFGASEQNITTALHAAEKKDDEIIIATKWSPFLRTAKNITRTIEKRLHFLQSYSIDLYMIHMPMSFSSIEDQMDAMAKLVGAGKIRAVGVSNFDAEQMRLAHTALEKRGLPLAVNQVQYNLLDRDIEVNGVLETAKELGITIIAWGPLGSGILTGKFHKNPELLDRSPYMRRMIRKRKVERSKPIISLLEEVAARYKVSPAQVALNWLMNVHGEAVVAIPGASRPEHAEQSAGAMQFSLSEDDMARLSEAH